MELRRRQWHPTPVLLPGKPHGWRSLMGCSPWGRWESDTTEWLNFHFSLSCIGEGNGNPLQCSCRENPRDGGAWWAAVYGVAQNWIRLKWLSSSSSSGLDIAEHRTSELEGKPIAFKFRFKKRQVWQGSPNPGSWIITSCQNRGGIRLEVIYAINVMFLNHPPTIPQHSWSVEKLSSTKLAPGARSVGDRCHMRDAQRSYTHIVEFPEQWRKKIGRKKFSKW